MKTRRGFHLIVLITVLVSLFAQPLAVTTVSADTAGSALQFNGTNQYVTIGDTRYKNGTLENTPIWNTAANSKLGQASLTFNGSSQYVTTGIGTEFNSAAFSVETWFYRTGPGVGVTTGGSGIASAIPLLTKGTSEGETPAADINYFLGIDATSAKLVADFEEGASGSSPSLNHPITGVTAIALNTWNHAAVTYDGNKWQLFLNGNLENELVVGRPANAVGISPLALATSIRSNGSTIQGYFAGRLDETRVWNYARTQSEIQDSMNSEILIPTNGLLGRWGLNDASGTTASNLNRLGITSFTLEAWVKRAAGEATMSTGTNGLDGASGRPLAYPVLTKGMGEGETPANINTNWFLGITSTGMIGADFEDNAGGVNHPAWGTTSVAIGEWHHIAATYDGSCWTLYLDGNPETLNASVVSCPNATPESTSYQRAALSAGINSSGGLGAGYFSGVIDEARVWNRALSSTEISTNKYLEMTSGSGLVARWGMNENAGTILNSSVGAFPGTLTNNPTWVSGFPDLTPPAAPTGLSVTSAVGQISLAWVANNEPDLAGYNVYRSTTSPVTNGTPLNSSLLISPAYTDIAVTTGTTYFYAVTAIDASGNESDLSAELSAAPTPPPPGAHGLDLGSGTAYVAFGDPTKLDLTQFTIETWFKRTGAGKSNTTGDKGITSAIPLVAHGSPESDGSDVDANWILVIDDTDDVLAADFEDMTSGLNHPVYGKTVITNDVWHHAAATYDGTTWRLYLDGILETTLAVNAAPRSDSIQRVGLGTMIESGGATHGHFQGLLDETRVWNIARTQTEIVADINNELTSGNGLVARWGFGEGWGTNVGDSVAEPANGTIKGAGASWAETAPFNLVVDITPPVSPSGLAAAAGNAQVTLTWTANSETDLSGYNIYRSTTSPVIKDTPLNSALLTSLSYTDATAQNGTTYFYAITALDGSGNESDLSTELSATPQLPPPGAYALDLGSGSAYVTFGDPSKLDLAQFTIETWFMRTGDGTSNTTGTNGIANSIPLVTHGSPQDDGSNVDENWIMAIDDATDVLAADFEDMASGANHPVYGVTPITENVWHHAAATYDGTTWRLYLDGILETTLVVNAAPRSDSIQRAGLGTMIESTGATHGHFQGVLDEVRIWNKALNQSDIVAGINDEIPDATGLVARYGFSEGYDGIIHDSVSNPVAADGTITNTGSAWTTGAPFNVAFTPPAAPIGLAATAVSGAQVSLTWTDISNNEANFEIERSTTGSSGTFSPLASLSANTNAYSDNGLEYVTQYCYRVRATNPGGSSSYTDPACVTTPPEPNNAIDFGSNNSYVTFGNPPALGLSQFTLETWFKREGTSVSITTGTGGIAHAIPLLTKGTSDADDRDNRDMNYFLGIDADANVLAADFEEGATGASPSLNHPIRGTTPIALNTWYHVAVTYDGSKWQLFLNGQLEAESTVGQPPRADSASPAAMATSIKAVGTTAQGFFDGVLDEARVWNYARTQSQVQSTINTQITAPQTGLVGRWSLNEGAGTAINGSAGTSINGTITGSGYTWVDGAPFNISFTPPAAPTGLDATSAGSAIILNWTDNANNESAFQVERSTTGSGGQFTLLTTVSANTTNYSNIGLDTTTEYCYKVRATNANGSSVYTDVACAITGTESAFALALGANNAYVSLGDNADLSQFTLETWLRRDGLGTAISTGTNGETLIPVITNGTAEVDTVAADINYFFGIRSSDGVICADFEEAQTGTTPGLNHPVCGSTPLATGTWYHAAVTYDGTTWHLYLNGILEATLVAGQPANTANTSQLAFGTSMKTTEATAGFFNGTLDEVRIWHSARSQGEIQGTINAQIREPQTDLVARYGLNEGIGTTIASSAGTTINGTITGTGYSWVAGAPFNLAFNRPPNAPALVAPTNGATGIPLDATLSVTSADPENDPLTVTFYGRPLSGGNGPDFTLVALPDTQYYTTLAGGDATFNAQTQWVVDNQASQNIVFTSHLGDITDGGDTNTTDSQWIIADTAISKLERGTADPSDDVPFGLVVGNHDVGGGTTRFENHFGVARFTGRPYYGGHYGSNNLNSYSVFSASGMRFIVLNLACTDTTTPLSSGILDWADVLLKADLNRRGIVICHTLFTSTSALSTPGQSILDALSDNPNLFLMLGGHVPGFGRLTRQGTDGHTINLLLSDYQNETNGGNGWLRLMKFSPANSQIQITTYSPTLNQYKTDSGNQFSLSYAMQGSSFTQVGTANIASGETASTTWSNLNQGVQYEWYTTVSDGRAATSGPTWSFTTLRNTPPAITSDPTDQTVTAGQPATFSAAADGRPAPAVQWQVSTNGGSTWSNISGATAPDYTFTAQAVDNGKRFRAVFTNSEGTATTNATILTVNYGPVVTTHPASLTVNAGQTATFTAAASGNPAPGVQWQVSLDGIAWSDIADATSTTLNVATTKDDNGKQYRAEFTNPYGPIETIPATLIVIFAPTVNTQPASLTILAGQTATFNAVADGNPPPTVQWQVSTNNGKSWKNISGATSNNYAFTAQSTDNGKRFRAVFTNPVGTATSSYAILTIGSGSVPSITQQPASLTVAEGQSATFTAAASGNPTPTVQWQESTDNGSSWNNISGGTSTTYSFNAQLADNGKQFRAIFTNTYGTATSNTAALTVTTNSESAPVITQQPGDQSVNAGQTATFTAAASGNPTPTVQWQVSIDNGSSWSDIDGATSTTYSFSPQATDSGKQYHAVFTNSAGTTTTNAATLTVTTATGSPPAITLQPANQTVAIGQTATFIAAASGDPTLTVQWQVSKNGGKSWTNINGATSATYTFMAQKNDNGHPYRAVFTNSYGTATTNSATLTVQ